ncbi:hypothetical protein EXM22_07905 [Oceanispirochaeta crateris]|uniref:WD40 repeat domain-containing protein n=1 Tax=Oceanispirochaeta crateris TaxID=2518645 RepID=A0A5C1QMX3_9SPIO|nr:hypothetical protein [Oceanispirochaeta crateris]QEN07916.1 hypothetical protein EXM22_07905 [Oceanispirochaeta crateris]
MNKTFFLPLIILFFLIYYLMFPVKGGKEIYWTASELHHFGTMNHSPDSLSVPLVINQGRHRGVLLPDGGTPYLLNEEERAAVSESHFLIQSTSASLILKDLESQSEKIIPSQDYPLILSGHFYAADFGSAILEEFDSSGKSLWKWRGTSPITAISASTLCTVFGSVDGRIRIFSRQGEMTEFIPGDQREDNVIYGIAFSQDCSKLAVLSGLNKQYIRQYHLKEDEAPELFHEELLESRFSRPVKLFYSESASLLWVEQESSLLQYRGADLESTLLLDGTLLTQNSDEQAGLVYVLNRLGPSSFSDKSYEVAVYTMTGTLIMRNRFDEYPPFFFRSGRDIFLSMNDDLISLKRVDS